MELQIRGNGIAVSDDLRQFAEKRAAKLDRLVDRVVEAKLELRARHNRSGPDTVTAQLTIQTGRHLLRAEEHDPDVLAAVDRVVDKLGRQVRRVHEKRTDRKGPRPEPIAADADGAPDPELADLDLDPDADLDPAERDEAARDRLTGLVRTKRFSLKPMDVDEAIEQMELLGHDFYLFHNAAEETFNVVYRRRDGTYGLLAPHRG